MSAMDTISNLVQCAVGLIILIMMMLCIIYIANER